MEKFSVAISRTIKIRIDGTIISFLVNIFAFFGNKPLEICCEIEYTNIIL